MAGDLSAPVRSCNGRPDPGITTARAIKQTRYISSLRRVAVGPVGGHTRYEICHVVWTPEDLEDFEILAEHVESLGKVPLVFALTTHGMAMGPVSSTVYVGLDLAAGSKADS